MFLCSIVILNVQHMMLRHLFFTKLYNLRILNYNTWRQWYRQRQIMKTNHRFHFTSYTASPSKVPIIIWKHKGIKSDTTRAIKFLVWMWNSLKLGIRPRDHGLPSLGGSCHPTRVIKFEVCMHEGSHNQTKIFCYLPVNCHCCMKNPPWWV